MEFCRLVFLSGPEEDAAFARNQIYIRQSRRAIGLGGDARERFVRYATDIGGAQSRAAEHAILVANRMHSSRPHIPAEDRLGMTLAGIGDGEYHFVGARPPLNARNRLVGAEDRKSTRLNSSH